MCFKVIDRYSIHDKGSIISENTNAIMKHIENNDDASLEKLFKEKKIRSKSVAPFTIAHEMVQRMNDPYFEGLYLFDISYYCQKIWFCCILSFTLRARILCEDTRVHVCRCSRRLWA